MSHLYAARARDHSLPVTNDEQTFIDTAVDIFMAAGHKMPLEQDHRSYAEERVRSFIRFIEGSIVRGRLNYQVKGDEVWSTINPGRVAHLSQDFGWGGIPDEELAALGL